MTSINAVILAADNATSLKLTQSLTTHYPSVTILASTDNIIEGEKLIHQHQPNLVIVEIELDNDNAMTLLNNLNPYHFEVMFISRTKTSQTIYYTYTNITCLTIPYEPLELKYAFNKAYEKIRSHSMVLPGNIETDMSIYHSMNLNLSIYDNDMHLLIRMGNIAYLHSGNGCTTVFLNDKTVQMSSSQIGEIEIHLPANIFFRIHRSYIANIKSIKSSFTRDREFYLLMNNGDEIPVSEFQREALLAMLNKNIA